AAKALAHVHNITVHESALRAHVMRPSHVKGVTSSRGLHEGTKIRPVTVRRLPSQFLDVKAFGDALHAALKDSVAGYVMQLRQNSKTIYTLEWKGAKTKSDGSRKWTPAVRMHVASCSKLITAMAMTRLLDHKKISYDAAIASHLPHYWKKGPNVGKVTFRHLMTHTSGFNYKVKSSDSDYQFMKSQVEAGAKNLGKYWYQNNNFRLCPILIGTINGNISTNGHFASNIPFLGSLTGLPFINDMIWDFVTIQSYVKYVQEHVFKPAGVTGPTLNHPSPDALAYNFPVDGGGWDSGDLSSMSGGAGWHMSPDDYLSVMGAFRRKGTIMSNKQAQAMLDNGFGIDVIMGTPLGTLYNKNGSWSKDGHQEQSLAYFLPDDMELVVLANSPIGKTGKFFRDVVTNIYSASIKS